MNRKMKAVLMGVGLLAGLGLIVVIARLVWFLAILMLPFLVIGAAVYMLGYGAPNFGTTGRKIHRAAEIKARHFLDWLDFKSPSRMWPMINASRTFLDWFGLRVGKA